MTGEQHFIVALDPAGMREYLARKLPMTADVADGIVRAACSYGGRVFDVSKTDGEIITVDTYRVRNVGGGRIALLKHV